MKEGEDVLGRQVLERRKEIIGEAFGVEDEGRAFVLNEFVVGKGCKRNRWAGLVGLEDDGPRCGFGGFGYSWGFLFGSFIPKESYSVVFQNKPPDEDVRSGLSVKRFCSEMALVILRHAISKYLGSISMPI